MSSKTVYSPYVMLAAGPDRYTTGTNVTLSHDEDEFVLTIDSGQVAVQVPLTPEQLDELLSCKE